MAALTTVIPVWRTSQPTFLQQICHADIAGAHLVSRITNTAVHNVAIAMAVERDKRGSGSSARKQHANSRNYAVNVYNVFEVFCRTNYSDIVRSFLGLVRPSDSVYHRSTMELTGKVKEGW